MQDKKWAERLAAGDEAAFRELYQTHADGIYRLCLRLLQNRQEAEDAAQEVFLKIIASLPTFRAEARLSSWIFRITLNTCLNLRRQRKVKRWLSLEWLEAQPEAAAAEEGAQRRVERQEEEALLTAAIDRLPEKQRVALILCRFEEKSYQEIAEILGCSVAAVESRIFQAKKNLGKMLVRRIKDTSFD
ncbi:MAG TPA: RNA polymerase sigma factor [bacterium]|nr:RNA polymerase sigma factor [bacterium]HQG45883.1 RNA polymerase sigma factor [bacterium]HQI48339.1 RNA polymerase sigma factor [bacterium]HQJ63441.1 RNA polymerase sigma factor [bacterium]